MIILDTNVLSALMRREVESSVLEWFGRVPPDPVWTTSVTIFEVSVGLELLPMGRRREQLQEAFDKAVRDDLGGRILFFDTAAAQAAAGIVVSQRRAGRSVEIRDVQIAGIAAARKATLATRNTRHFERVGISLVDPWSA